MAKIIYGVFSDQASAERACRALTQDSKMHPDRDVVLHSQHMRVEDVQFAGSDTIKQALGGAVLVGVLGALVGALVIGPIAGLAMSAPMVILLGASGSLFGFVAGAVAGASECKPVLRALTEEVERGRVVVTVETDRRDAPQVTALMTGAGGVQVAAA